MSPDAAYSIAIVDDEPTILDLLDKFFTKQGGFKVATFKNPVTALPVIQRDKYDLVMLDIQMPQMDGLEFLDHLMKGDPEQKVMMMTAYSTLSRVLKSHKHGACQYVMKPFDNLRELQHRVTELITN